MSEKSEDLQTTVIAVAVHRRDQDAVFGRATHVKLEDEGAGQFISLEQSDDGLGEGQVRLDIDELELILVEAKKLLDQK